MDPDEVATEPEKETETEKETEEEEEAVKKVEVFDIYNIEQMTPFVLAKARKLARNWSFRDDVFSIHLVRRMARSDMVLVEGSVVRIELLWPDVMPYLDSKLRSAFSAIRKHGLHRPFAIASYAYFARERGEARGWIKQKLGKDIAESLASLIPRHRIVTIKTETIQVIDTITGTVVERTKSSKGDVRDAPFEMWSDLSQLVFDKHPNTVDYSEEIVAELIDTPSNTPALDETLTESPDRAAICSQEDEVILTENDNPYDNPDVRLP
jgi:hypothetical protein